MLGGESPRNGGDSLRSFLKDSIVPAPGHNITSKELLELYGEYCEEKEWAMLPHNVVKQQLTDLMGEMFGVARRHDIKRKGADQRGYWGVSIS